MAAFRPGMARAGKDDVESIWVVDYDPATVRVVGALVLDLVPGKPFCGAVELSWGGHLPPDACHPAWPKPRVAFPPTSRMISVGAGSPGPWSTASMLSFQATSRPSPSR